MANLMNEAIVHAGPRVEIIKSSIPTPGEGQLLIKTYYAASNPKDWRRPTLMNHPPANQGDDVAGIVNALGPNTLGFSIGDRVAALHRPGGPFGTYAEYCVVESWATWHVPNSMKMAEAATIPLTSMTAGVALWRELSVPWPWTSGPREPIIIYGASTAVGAFALKFAKLSKTPVIAISGNGRGYVESLLDNGDKVIDYRDGEDSTITAIRAALGGQKVRLALDAISSSTSERILGKVLERSAHIATVLPLNPADDIEGIERSFTISPLVFGHANQDGMPKNANRWFGTTIVKMIEMAVKDGLLKGHPYEIVEGGLEGIEAGLKSLQKGSSHGPVKYVYAVVDKEI